MVPRTRLAYIASIVLAIFAFVIVCGATVSRADGPVEITFWHAMSRSRGKVLNQLVDEFNKANPNIVVKSVCIQSQNKEYGNDYNALYSKILENIAKNTPPDVAQVYENWTTQYVGIDALVPIESLILRQEGCQGTEILLSFQHTQCLRIMRLISLMGSITTHTVQTLVIRRHLQRKQVLPYMYHRIRLM